MKQNYRNTDPETSMLAGEAVTKSGKRASQMELIYTIIKEAAHPIATEEIADLMGHPHPNPVSKRISDLINAGRIRRSGTLLARTGHLVHTYEVNPDPQPVEKPFKPCKKTLADMRANATKYCVLMHEAAKAKKDTHHDCEKMIWALRAFLDAYEKNRGIENGTD